MSVNQSADGPSSLFDPDVSWKKRIKPMMKGVRHDSLEAMNLEETDVLDFPEPCSSTTYSSSVVASSSPPSSLSSASHAKNDNGNENANRGRRRVNRPRESFSSMNSESLSLCTEGLGFESLGDADDWWRNDVICWKESLFDDEQGKTTSESIEATHGDSLWREPLTSKSSFGSRATFPPPISSIGESGKPLVCFRSIRKDGRFILKEIRIPTSTLLHTCRENGRLKMKFLYFEDEDEDDEESIANE